MDIWPRFSDSALKKPLRTLTQVRATRDPTGAMRQWSNSWLAGAPAEPRTGNAKGLHTRESAALFIEANKPHAKAAREPNEWVKRLKALGVLGWNKWRADNPTEIPDLSGVDFSDEAIWRGSAMWRDGFRDPKGKQACVLHEDDPDDPHRQVGIDFGRANLDRAILAGSGLRNARLQEATLRGADLTSTDLTGADLTRADLFEANLNKARFVFAILEYAWLDKAKKIATAEFHQTSCPYAWFSTTGERTDLEGVNFSGCDLSFARLERADFAGANFKEANLQGARLQGAHFGSHGRRNPANLCEADLRESNMDSANIEGCDLRETRWDGAKTTDIKFGSLEGRCGGAGGIDNVYGSSRFRRELRDQEFIDSMRNSVTDGPLIDFDSAVTRGVLAGIVLYAAAKTVWPGAEQFAIRAAIVGAIAGLVSATRLGASVLMSVWWLLGYGRSITAVAAFAIVSITAIGFAYNAGRGVDFIVALPDETCRTLGVWTAQETQNCPNLKSDYDISKHPAYPWFVAVMGFCTLSVTDLIFPKTGLGAMIIMANVLVGFLTLGLLLAVLADKFSRRN